MTLVTIASEIIGDIVSLVEGSDVVRLLLIGNHALTYKIRHSTIPTVDFLCPRFSRFPSVLYSLPGIKQLAVRTDDDHGIPLELPAAPPEARPQLVSIHFAFAQSFVLLEGPTPLKVLTPNLQQLVLQESTVYIRDHHLVGLPEGLVKIVLSLPNKAGVDIRHLPAISCSVIKNSLPKTLEIISLQSCLSNPDNVPGPIWPPSLRHLTIPSLEDISIFKHFLTPSIEELDISYLMTNTGTTVTLQAHELPPKMRRFNVGLLENNVRLELNPGDALPPQLKYFNLQIINGSSSPLTSFFPPNLESYQHEFWDSDSCPVSELPSSWKSLSPSRELTVEELSHLPKRLQTLSLRQRLPIPFEQFPPSITQLSLHELRPSDLQYLPNLTCLHMYSRPNSALTPEEFFKRLPRGLIQLWLDPFKISSLECLDFLPNGLKTLRFNSGPEGDPISTVLADTSDMIKRLPASLTSLKIIADRRFYPVASWGCHISHMTNLQSLTLCPAECRRGDKNDDIRYLKLLPHSLQDLVLFPTHSWDDNLDCLDYLPPKLLSLTFILDIARDDDAAVQLDDRHFHHLPSSLQHLSICNASGLTQYVLKHIPRRISHLSIDHLASQDEKNWADLLSAYYSNPIWQGTHEMK